MNQVLKEKKKNFEIVFSGEQQESVKEMLALNIAIFLEKVLEKKNPLIKSP